MTQPDKCPRCGAISPWTAVIPKCTREDCDPWHTTPAPSPEPEVSELLGKYLNTMVADLGIMDNGQYLRELFSRYEAERDAENADLRRQLQEREQISKGWRDSFDREVETHAVTRKLLAERERAKTAERQLQEAKEELQKLLNDWNALVKASGSPTNGGAVGHVAQMKRQLQGWEKRFSELHIAYRDAERELQEARERGAQLEEALRGLSNEIKGWLGVDRGELTQLLSVTNIRVMERKLAEAEATRGGDKLGSEKEKGK